MLYIGCELIISALDSGSCGPVSSPGTCFSKATETFRARKSIFSYRYLKTEKCGYP